MKRSLLLFLSALVLPVFAHAQSPVVDTEPEFLKRALHFSITTLHQEQGEPKAAGPKSPLFEVEVGEPSIVVEPYKDRDRDVPIYGSIRNLTGDTLEIGFERVQTLAEQWKSMVCFGTNCYSDRVSKAQEVWQQNQMRDLLLHVVTPPSALDSSDIRLKLFATRDPSQSIIINYRATAMPWSPDTCRVIRVPNKTGEFTKVRSVTIDNVQDFTMSVASGTPYEIFGDQYVDINLCVRRNDGGTYSTTISVETDHGSFQQLVTMVALNSNSVNPYEIEGVKVYGVFPNPVTGSRMLNVDLVGKLSTRAEFMLCDMLGKPLFSEYHFVAAGHKTVQLDLPELPSGSYLLIVKADGKLLDQVTIVR